MSNLKQEEMTMNEKIKGKIKTIIVLLLELEKFQFDIKLCRKQQVSFLIYIVQILAKYNLYASIWNTTWNVIPLLDHFNFLVW